MIESLITNTFFNTFFYKPLLNGLILLYQYLPGRDFGVAVIVLTILVKFIFYPLGTKAIRSQKVISELQPKVKEIQKKYKDNKEQQTKELMELYKKEKINPFSGCLPLLVQLPVLFALFLVFWKGFEIEASMLYNFVPFPGTINPFFLGMVNLAKPSYILAILAGITQYFQMKTAMPKTESTKKKSSDIASSIQSVFQKQMHYFFPVITVFILLTLPSAIGLYWVANGLFTILQQYLVFKKQPQSAV